MTITIYEIPNSNYVVLKTKNEDFKKRYGESFGIPEVKLFKTMVEIAIWANNELHEECLFEVD